MKEVNWNVLSQLGLIKRINHEILHPLGLAMTRNSETGFSESILVSDDGIWEYENKEVVVLSKEEVDNVVNNVVN
ncbi:MAG: hypothetical protein WC679_01655 [Bacteroidales bacterium]|jgi:uncharacterized protein